MYDTDTFTPTIILRENLKKVSHMCTLQIQHREPVSYPILLTPRELKTTLLLERPDGFIG